MNVQIPLVLATCLALFSCEQTEPAPRVENADRIQPYSGNPAYWQYKGEPVLLLGGSDNDNLFQSANFREQLALLADAGGNYVRCTMSSRDSGDVWPFEKEKNTGLYDLKRFNSAYWDRLDGLLEGAADEGIIIQVEIWATFDFYDGRDHQYPRNWSANPFNPKNNNNYSSAQVGLPEVIPSHPTQTENPFFFSVPAAENNRVLLPFQEAFVDKLLEHTLPFGNVLYCMDNETSVTPAWGAYWSGYIRQSAQERSILVQTTEMWDPWDLAHEMHSNTFNLPEIYTFVDVSQNNHQTGQKHWDNAQLQRDRIQRSGKTRPLSNVKVYGADTGRFGTGRDGIERYWRNILGGMASSRFHRPDSGIGLNQVAQTHIRSLRMVTDSIGVFNATPSIEILSERDENEAYAMIGADGSTVVFFPDGGKVSMEANALSNGDTLNVNWLDISDSDWQPPILIKATDSGALLEAPGMGYWAAWIPMR